jgi:hypothetical protein
MTKEEELQREIICTQAEYDAAMQMRNYRAASEFIKKLSKLWDKLDALREKEKPR